MDDLLLQKYLRNETSEEELVEVLDWLDASTENQRYLDRLDYISNLNILAGEAQPVSADIPFRSGRERLNGVPRLRPCCSHAPGWATIWPTGFSNAVPGT